MRRGGTTLDLVAGLELLARGHLVGEQAHNGLDMVVGGGRGGGGGGGLGHGLVAQLHVCARVLRGLLDTLRVLRLCTAKKKCLQVYI